MSNQDLFQKAWYYRGQRVSAPLMAALVYVTRYLRECGQQIESATTALGTFHGMMGEPANQSEDWLKENLLETTAVSTVNLDTVRREESDKCLGVFADCLRDDATQRALAGRKPTRTTRGKRKRARRPARRRQAPKKPA